jgi:hypothetical protein
MLNIALFFMSSFVFAAEQDDLSRKTLSDLAREDSPKTGILNKIGEAGLLDQQEDSQEKMPLQDIEPGENL